ncbi:tyrosine-type recombinase/integrase [Hyphomicrobium sp. 99]|uniref:tyrosine-type recombinase/integrase n=1 Tax=Hyphomicrobium sp. 99 TaxID=1163419 RepID=UPI0005F7649E|nr:tyrosine-type recombinase/integrase [Hyphomicrobium sp. 99]
MSEIANNIALSLHPTTSHLSEHARLYSAASLRPTTRRAYAAALEGWLEWRDQEELEPALPVDVANYIAGRAAAGQSVSTLRTIIAALKAGHEAKGWTFDSSSPVVSRVLRGIANLEYRLPRQAEPLHGATLLRILNAIASVERPSIIDRRDAALLALGYTFALRRSELVGLDFHEQGRGEQRGTGVLRMKERTIEIAFAISKTASGQPEVVTVPRDEAIETAKAIEAWLEVSNIHSGEPLFRSVSKSGKIRQRLSGQSVSLIVKARFAEHARIEHGFSSHSAKLKAQHYSGHSLRVGFCVSAAENGADIRSIASVTRHRSLVMPCRYAQRADQIRTSPHRLQGIGLKSMEQ